MRARIFFFFLLFLVTGPPGFEAQDVADYRVTGWVHDGTGAVIPGAEVTLQQAGTDATFTQETDGQGNFQIAVPAAGDYVVEVRADGFAIYRGQAVVSKTAPSAAVEVTLRVSGSTESVEVTANSLEAETTSTQLGETLETRKIESVPLNGRNFTDLMAVQAGIVPVNTAQPGAVIMTGVANTPPSGNANPGNLSISGQREDSNGFRVNGADVEEDVNMGTSIVPNLDAIDSFRVLTSNFDAEYGNSSGGQILVTTKSGTAQVHGSAFEFLRNTDLDARNYFSSNRAAFRQNQYGAAWAVLFFGQAFAGLPIIRGRGSLRESTRVTSRCHPWPSAGDFTQVPLTGSVNGSYWAAQLSSELGQAVTPGEPYAQVFPTGQIPRSIWTAPAKYLLASIPQPNEGNAVFETAAAAQTLQDDKGGLRADWTEGKQPSWAITFLTSIRWIIPTPRERAAPACRASTPPARDGRN